MPELSRPRLLLFAAASFACLTTAPAAANQPVCSEAACDEQQIGPYVGPDIALPDRGERFDPRGRPVKVPVPGLDGVVVRHRPGAGVWVSEAPGKANVFIKPSRERVSLDVKVDF
jgi:hypothetical protein